MGFGRHIICALFPAEKWGLESLCQKSSSIRWPSRGQQPSNLDQGGQQENTYRLRKLQRSWEREVAQDRGKNPAFEKKISRALLSTKTQGPCTQSGYIEQDQIYLSQMLSFPVTVGNEFRLRKCVYNSFSGLTGPNLGIDWQIVPFQSDLCIPSTCAKSKMGFWSPGTSQFCPASSFLTTDAAFQEI